MLKKATTLLLSVLLTTIMVWAGGSKESDPVEASKNFDFSTWKIQLPEANESRTSVKEVKAPELAAGYASDYFYYDKDGAIVFYCPVNGFKTANTTYSRSELRELIDGEHTNINWTLHGTHKFHCSEKVIETPSNGRTVVSQIHGVAQDGSNGPVLVKVEYDGSQNAVVALLKTATYDHAADERHYLYDINLGDVFDTTINVVEGRVFVTVTSGDKKLECSKNFYKEDPNWDTYRFYYKVGNYVQDSILDYEGESATVKLFNFGASHSEEIETTEPTAIQLQKKLSMQLGQDVTITPSFVPFDTTNIDCTWSIVNGNDVIALSNNGQITARKLGDATIQATSVENPNLSTTCLISVGPKVKKEAKLVYENDFEKPLGSEWELEGSETAVVQEKDGKLSYTDSDVGHPAPALLTLPAPIPGTSTVQLDITLESMDIKDAGTSKEQASYYYIEAKSDENNIMFRLRNKADLNAGQLLDPRVVLSCAYLDPNMNKQAAKTPLNTTHTMTMIITGDDHSAKANTTDVYIDGIKIGDKIKNRDKKEALAFLRITSGTKDLINFHVDNLKIYEGAHIPDNAAPAAVTIAQTPSVIGIGDSTRIKTSSVTSFKITKGTDYAAVSDNGLVTGLAEGMVTVNVGNQKDVTISIKKSVKKAEKLEIVKPTVIVEKGDTVNIADTAKVFPTDATETSCSFSILNGKDIIKLDGSNVTALKNGTAKIEVSALGNDSLVKYITISVVTTIADGTVLFKDDFSQLKFNTKKWTVQSANKTQIKLENEAMKVDDTSTGGLPKAYVTFEPIASTFTMKFKFKLLNDEQVSGEKSSCATIVFGADKITSTANESFKFKAVGTYNETSKTVENRHFIYSKPEGETGFFDIDMPVERNVWYEITMVTTPDNGTATANTTDIYINGKKVVSGAKNKRIIPTYDKMNFTTGTKDRATFLIDDLLIVSGDATLQ